MTMKRCLIIELNNSVHENVPDNIAHFASAVGVCVPELWSQLNVSVCELSLGSADM